MNNIDRIIQIIRDLKEESGPTMSMGHGQIAGSVESGDDPPVRMKKKVRKYMKGPGRKVWLDYLKSSNGRRN